MTKPGAEYLLVRTATDPTAFIKLIEQSIWFIDPEQPVALIRTMDDYVQLEVRDHAHQMNIFAIFAGLALFLASLGIYGVLAHRSRSAGVKSAFAWRLGPTAPTSPVSFCAVPWDLPPWGLVIGTALTALSTQAIRALLFEVKPFDPCILSLGALVLLASALAACLAPALTASRVDPMLALRDE